MAIVLVLMALDYPVGTWTLILLLFVIPLLIIGWFAVRDRVNEIARVREGFTGAVPAPMLPSRALSFMRTVAAPQPPRAYGSVWSRF